MNAENIHNMLAIATIALSCAILSPILCWALIPPYPEES